MREIVYILYAMLVIACVATIPALGSDLYPETLDHGKDGLVINVTGDYKTAGGYRFTDNGIATITNVGTSKRDVGGLRITAGGGIGMNDSVGMTPYTCVLDPGESVKVKLYTRAFLGDEIRLTNGVGTYAKGVAA